MHSRCRSCSLPRSNLDEFVKKANEKHNYGIDYSEFVYVNGHTKGIMRCKKCQYRFLKPASAHLFGEGCPKCSGKMRSSIEDFSRKSHIKHKRKYDYSKFIYVNNSTKGIIRCKTCGYEFPQSPNDHLDGCGCPKCAGRYKRNKSDAIHDFILVHHNNFDYSKVKYVDLNTKIVIICKKCGATFLQKPQKHLDGHGCPHCNLSRGESKIKNFMDKNGISYVSQKIFDGCRNPRTNYHLRFDFYVPFQNLLIEYDGKQHFKVGCLGGRYFMTEKDLHYIKYKDKIKSRYAFMNNIDLLRIPYTKLDSIDKILRNKLLV